MLALGAAEQSFPAGAVLYRAGTEPQGIYIVLSGCVRLVRTRDGRQHAIYTERSGGTLAELAFFNRGLLRATALASEPSRCLILNRAALDEAIRAEPVVAWLFLARLASRVWDYLDALERAASRTGAVPARLASYLLARAEEAGPDPFSLGLTRTELAEEVASGREAVVRALGALKKAGVIASVGRGRYTILDITVLRELARADAPE